MSAAINDKPEYFNEATAEQMLMLYQRASLREGGADMLATLIRSLTSTVESLSRSLSGSEAKCQVACLCLTQHSPSFNASSGFPAISIIPKKPSQKVQLHEMVYVTTAKTAEYTSGTPSFGPCYLVGYRIAPSKPCMEAERTFTFFTGADNLEQQSGTDRVATSCFTI